MRDLQNPMIAARRETQRVVTLLSTQLNRHADEPPDAIKIRPDEA